MRLGSVRRYAHRSNSKAKSRALVEGWKPLTKRMRGMEVGDKEVTSQQVQVKNPICWYLSLWRSFFSVTTSRCMFKTVFRFGVRSFHATPSGTLTRSRISKILSILSKETREPLWHYINETQTSRLLATPHGLKERDPYHEYLQSKTVTRQIDIEEALKTLETIQTKTRPPWLVFYIVLYKVRSSVHANGPMMGFVYSQLDSLPLDHRGPLLIFAALHLAKFNLLQPLKRVVETFLTTELSHDSLQFNLLLQALSLNSVRSTESAGIVVQILNAMDGRQLKLRSETYHALLNDRFVTVQLTKYLRSRMTHEGVVPSIEQLESYLRVFAKGGAIHETQSYFDAIRKRDMDYRKRGRLSNLALSAFKDRASAFEFLDSLLLPGQERLDIPAPYLLPFNKKKLDSHSYATSLSVAARDMTIEAPQLIHMLRRMDNMGGSVRITLVAYTIVIRGLLFRKAFGMADRLWGEVRNVKYVLDKPALMVGLETLTCSEKPHKAFELLEEHGYKQPRLASAAALIPPGPRLVDIHVLNSFMNALNESKRPDVVFRLWDYMEGLYGVHPASETLSIVLEAARVACQLDNTFHGALSHFSLRNPFRRPVSQPTVREEMVGSITSVVGDKKKMVRYATGIWNDAHPFESARVVFLQAVFGNAGEELMRSVEPPAFALRRSIDSDSASSSVVVVQLPPNLLNPEGKSWYPHIVPTNDHFQKYLVLLGLNGRADEIPITLAWMRASGVRPGRATLAVAMVFWGEVSRHAPLVESWTGGEAKSQFTRLWLWVKEWVGEERMPEREDVGRWLHRVRRMREGEE